MLLLERSKSRSNLDSLNKPHLRQDISACQLSCIWVLFTVSSVLLRVFVQEPSIYPNEQSDS